MVSCYSENSSLLKIICFASIFCQGSMHKLFSVFAIASDISTKINLMLMPALTVCQLIYLADVLCPLVVCTPPGQHTSRLHVEWIQRCQFPNAPSTTKIDVFHHFSILQVNIMIQPRISSSLQIRYNTHCASQCHYVQPSYDRLLISIIY